MVYGRPLKRRFVGLKYGHRSRERYRLVMEPAQTRPVRAEYGIRSTNEAQALMRARFTSNCRPRTRAAATALTLLLILFTRIGYAGDGPPRAEYSAARQSTAAQAALETHASKTRLQAHAHGWWRRRWVLPTAAAVAFLAAMRIHEGSGHGPFGIDYRLKRGDNNGLFSRSNQLGLEYGTVAFEAAGALFLGNHKGLGHTFWQAADASVFAGAAAQVLKIAFRRARPVQGQGPNAWFKGSDQSFPSGEVTLQASFVTPFILDYRRKYPWIWAAELLPVYDAYGRMKSQGHWQSDAIAGWALGTAFGYWATRRKVPLLVEILPHGVSVGFYKRF